ncbi:hypothetical protein KKF19_00955 [Patescibacteria group bacterium]|nr:hypothetical protein [Patescibacteria group bacterium]
MTKKTQTIALYFSIIIVAIASVFWVNGLILAWTTPVSAPPGSNVAAPLNVGSTAQTKSGSLISSSDMRAPIFYDQNNTGYYVDPAGMSNMNRVDFSYGYDRDNTAYYLDLNNTSKFNAVYANSYSGPGCDIAERYQASGDGDSQLEPGDIVVLDEDKEMNIKKSDKAYSTMVIGVVSTKPNLTMGALENFDNENYPPIALLGRVPTKVTAENGPIKIGDNIISSSRPGYGMKCDNYSKCQGAIVGKALQKLEGAEGVIEVLIK